MAKAARRAGESKQKFPRLAALRARQGGGIIVWDAFPNDQNIGHYPLSPSGACAGGWPKRAFDLVLAIGFLILLFPLRLLIASAVRLTSPGPALFAQERGGYRGKTFRILKFRTMRSHLAEAHVKQASHRDPRVTRVGAFLRKTSLDELPQLMNVVRGEMSLVGPRPHAVRHDYVFAAHDSRYWQRFSARPGITGLAQTRGARGEILNIADLNRRVDLDLDYVETCSLWGDIELLVSTLRLLFGDKNAY